MKVIYSMSSMTVHVHKESNNINIRGGVQQGDTISSKLFTAAFKSIFRRLTWETRALKLHLIFVSPTTYSCALIHHMNYNKCIMT